MSEGTDADILRVSVPVAQVSNVVTGCRRVLVSDVVVLSEKSVSRIEVSLADACRDVVVYCWEQHSHLSRFGVVLLYQW